MWQEECSSALYTSLYDLGDELNFDLEPNFGLTSLIPTTVLFLYLEAANTENLYDR